MSKLFFFILFPAILFGQVSDTTYFKVVDYEVFKVNEKVYEDGRCVTEKSKANPIESNAILMREIESVGIQHHRYAIEAMDGAGVFKSVNDANAKFLTKTRVSAVDSLKERVIDRLKGDWNLDGKECTIDGVLRKGQSVYEIETICLPWIRLVAQGNATDYFLIGADRYVSLGGSVLFKIKKE